MSAKTWRELHASAAVAYDALFDLRTACVKADAMRQAGMAQSLMTALSHLQRELQENLVAEVQEERAKA